ncbi:MAG: ArsR/SmtB family transcription factor [Acidimicrobiia bacterium]
MPSRPATPVVADSDLTSRPISEVKAELFRALAHPARIRVLEVLADGERSVGELQPVVGIELSHLSQQLGVLRRAGLVVARKQGSSVIYAIRDPLTVELLRVARQLLINALSETTDLLSDLRAAR